MARDVVDLLERLRKSAPDGLRLAGSGASTATVTGAAARFGPLPASYVRLVGVADGGAVYALELWPVARLVEDGDRVLFGTNDDDGEPLWWDRARRLGDECFCGQGDLREPTGGGAPGFEHLLAERAWVCLDERDPPPGRALRTLADHAKARGGRLGAGGITFATHDAEALPIQRLRGSVVAHAELAAVLRDAVEAIAGGPVEVARVESRIDHPLVHTRGRAEFAVWVETTRRGKAVVVRLAQPVWTAGLEGRLLGDRAGTQRDPVPIVVAGAQEAVAQLFATHLTRAG